MAAGMTGDRIEGYALRNIQVSEKTVWRHVVLETESGLTGTGEYTFDNAPPELSGMMGKLANSLIGQPALRNSLKALREALQGFVAHTLLSGLDQALADIEAQSAEMPLWRYIGGQTNTDTIAHYANINRRTTDRSAQGFARSAFFALEQGVRAIKIAPFDGLSPAACETPEGRALYSAGLDRIAAVSEVIDSNAPLMIDCHWRLSPDAAQSSLTTLAELGVTWLECPYPETLEMIDELLSLRGSANDLGIRLAGLETQSGWEGFRPYVEAGAYDVIMPDIKHAGGYKDILEIAENAADFGTAISLHNPSGPIAHFASVHLSATLGGEELLEIQFDETPLFDEITIPEPIRTGSTCPVSQDIGLGACLLDEIDAEKPVGAQ